MTKPVVLIAEELSPATVEALGPDFEVRHCNGTDRFELLRALPAADALLVRSATTVDAEALASAKRLKVVARAGVGVDNIDLDAATAKVLADNKVSVAPVGPGTASQSGGTTRVSFPITEGYVAVYPTDQPSYIRGTFSHSGGLKFTAGGKSLEVTDFIVNPGDSTLSATVGGSGAVAQILDLDGTNVKVSKDGQGNTLLDGTVAKLSATGADAMNKTFGVSLFKAGIPLGVVHIVATGEALAKS